MWRFQHTGVSGNTIRADITGINSFLAYHGLQVDLRRVRDSRLNKFYRGCTRLRIKHGFGQKRFYRRALIDKMLKKMLLALGTSQSERVIKGMLLFAKQTAFRSHNYVFTKSGGMCRIGGLKFYPTNNPKRLIVTLPRTKTHQIDAPVCETRTLKCRCDENYCAVHAVYDLVKDRMDHTNEAIFLLENGFPVTYRILRKVL